MQPCFQWFASEHPGMRFQTASNLRDLRFLKRPIAHLRSCDYLLAFSTKYYDYLAAVWITCSTGLSSQEGGGGHARQQQHTVGQGVHYVPTKNIHSCFKFPLESGTQYSNQAFKAASLQHSSTFSPFAVLKIPFQFLAQAATNKSHSHSPAAPASLLC